MHISVISTWSKVKVKVTGLLKCRKLHFSKSISSAILAWSSKLMVDHNIMGHSLQLVGARFSNFLLRKLSREFKLHAMSILHEFQMAIFPYCLRIDTQLGMLVVLPVLCMLIWRAPNPRSRSWGFWSSENCGKLHFSKSVSSAILALWWFIKIVWYLIYSLLETDFRTSF